MAKDKIILFGASEHTRCAIDIIEQEDKYEIYGIIDIKLNKGSDFAGYKIIGKDSELSTIINSTGIKKGLISIGDNFTRFRLFQHITSLCSDFYFVTTIHPSAIIGKNVNIGNGSIVMAGTIISNDSFIGKNCLLSVKSSLDHDSLMDDFSSLAPGVTTGGNVKIGLCTAIGLGANIIHGIEIGNHSVIGAGSMVNKKIGDNKVAYGIPVKEIRCRENGEAYL